MLFFIVKRLRPEGTRCMYNFTSIITHSILQSDPRFLLGAVHPAADGSASRVPGQRGGRGNADPHALPQVLQRLRAGGSRQAHSSQPDGTAGLRPGYWSRW